MTASYTTEQKTELKEIFALFDEQSQGKMSVSRLGSALRAAGRNPTEAEVAALTRTVKEKGSSVMTFEEFLRILPAEPSHASMASQANTFIQTLRAFDKEETGMLSIGELKYVLGGMGERLTDREMDDLIRGLEVSRDGCIRYEDFVRKVMSA